MAANLQLFLLQRQRLAGGDAQLPFDQIQAGDHFGDRVLDLQAGVHLHEVEGAVLVGDELDRAGADIANCLGRGNGGFAHLAAAFLGVMPGAGASSSTFWWRRCTEQSRSNR